ncbi:MAG: ABC transporter ATP-binding protein [Eubacteriales bacterium]|nr:ABC transporter ATP-binding protein [Eubacteriales bacterium]
MNQIPALVAMSNISKRFGTILANDNVNFSVGAGEIHALLGENGAGKSTLMNMLSGVYTPDGGSIYINGEEVFFSSPRDSMYKGVGMIHQHFKLVEILSALENVLLGNEKTLFLNKKKKYDEIKELSEKFSLDIDLNKKVYEMSVGEKQNLEILKVLYRGAKILVLDEPTAVLTPQETEKLFRIMLKLKEEGCAVIFISHKMNEVMNISDKTTVLLKGRSVKTLNTKETNPAELTEIMVGYPVKLEIKRETYDHKEEVFRMENLSSSTNEGVQVLKNVSFSLYSGEILSIAGIAGSGQKELCEAIAGLYKVDSGSIKFKGEEMVGKTPKEIIKKGISMSFIPEDRLGMGLVASMDIVDNILLKQYQKKTGFFIDRKPSRVKAKEIVEKLEIKTPGINHPIKNLSGGNIQKVLLGRELDSNPELLITAYPVRGLDINTCYKIYDLLNQEKKKGVAILYIGEDLDALIELSDRIMVINSGEIMGIVNASETTKEEIGLMMLGEKK